MKVFSSATKLVVTASVSAAVVTVSLRGFHRASGAPGRLGDLPDVGTILARSPDRSSNRSSADNLSGRDRRALLQWELKSRLFREDGSTNVGEVLGTGSRFPPLERSTVMFLHIFKCAGSTVRRMLVDWATAEGKNGAVLVSCSDAKLEEKICLASHELLDEPVQKEIMSRQKVLAGHFVWGFQRHVERPYLMITSLRNPLEVFVSGRQFLHPDMTESLGQAQAFISAAILDSLETGNPEVVDARGGVRTATRTEEQGHPSPVARSNTEDQIGGFIFRLSGDDKKKLHGDVLVDAAHDAMENLEEFWLVGVVEQYAGFLEVLRRLLDPEKKNGALWDKYSRKHLNSSPVETRDILAAIDPELVRRFNGSLALQWKVYEKAVDVWDVRCREVLPAKKHKTMCTVDPPVSTYR